MGTTDLSEAGQILETLLQLENGEKRRVLMRFFKTGKGEYGYGDRFLGITVPQVRAVVRCVPAGLPFTELDRLIYSEWHEARLCGFLLLVREMKAALPKRNTDTKAKAARRSELAAYYLENARQADNWDLVDLSCEYILGSWLLHPLPEGTMPSRDILDRLAGSDNLWEQRISIVSTLAFIRAGEFDDTLRISSRLLSHPHDLIHKAVGWMLRETGKRDPGILRGYLDENFSSMSRTTLRYAIEKMDAGERQYWLDRKA